ncbi:putative lipoprotein YfhM [Nymphon striatum]|nr:putative lipoprotein YfhM [Nymphon striatum]
MKLIDPRGRVVDTKTSTDSVGGFYAFKFKTKEKDQTGNWMVKAFVGGSSFSKSLMIETVRPNRLKLELNFTAGDSKEPAETIYSSEGTPKGTLFSQWLHGATASKLKADVSVKFSQKKTAFGKFTDYVFDDPARSLKSRDMMLLEGRLDEEGYLKFSKDFKVKGKPAGMLKAKFTSRVFEESGAFSISRSNVDYHPYSNYVGIKLPKGDATRGMLLTDKKHKVSIASLSAKGEEVSLNKVQISLYKIKWKWWWDKSSESLAEYADSRHKQLLQKDIISTVNGTGEWEFEIKYPSWGRYLIRACDLDGTHCTGKTVYIDWPGWAGRAQEEGSGAASRLNLFSDKTAYSVGDTATIQLPASSQGRALLSIETGSRILEQRWVEFEESTSAAAAGVNSSEKRLQFKVPITAEMAPNAYVHITLVTTARRPIRLYGIIPLDVKDANSYLLPKIQAATEWQPESKQTVTVSEDNGKAMNYTLAVVDEGLLGLTSFKTPNLHRHFYSKEALGIKTWDPFRSCRRSLWRKA